MEVQGTKEENLTNTLPHVDALTGNKTLKGEDCKLADEPSHSKPTQKIYIMTQILASVAVSLGSLVVGYCTAYTSPALVTLIDETSSVVVTKHQGSWIGGLMPLAALLGGALGGPLIEHLGRRNTILAISVPFIISWVVIATAGSVSIIYLGRALGGLCVGVGSLSFPVYLGEALQSEVRGQLGLFPTVFGNIGILICFTAGTYLDWSQLAWLGAALPIPFIALMLLIPKTPRWLVSRCDSGKPEKYKKKARKSLQWLRGKTANVEDELEEIWMLHNEGQKDKKSALKELFKREYSRAILISLGMMFFQQWSGINAVIFYTVSIFQDAGSTIDKNLCTIIVGIVNFASTFVATVLIERLGRKILLFISSVAMIITLMILGGFFYVKNEINYDISSFGWVPLASFVVYVIGFSLGFGPIPWLMMGEILPAKIRGTAAAFVTAFSWACTFVVTKTFTDIVDSIGTYGTFWMYGVICIFGLIFTIIYVPETKGRSLEDIEKKLSGKRSKSSETESVEKPIDECLHI